MDRDADVVVVGGGPGGSAVSTLIAAQGHRVLLLERNDRVGGCIRTEEITAPGFVHDVMATTFVLFLTSPAYAELGPELEKRGLAFAHTPTPTAVLLPDGRHAILAMDRKANVAAFEKLAEGDGARFAADIDRVGADAPFLFALLGGSLWSRAMLKIMAREVWRRGLRELAGHAERASERIPLADVTLHAPITNPQKIICLGLNYRDHAEETKQDIPSSPMWFAKFANSLIGSGTTLPASCTTSTFNGTYSFNGNGFVLNSGSIVGGSYLSGLGVFDGAGNVTTTANISIDGATTSQSTKGTYTVLPGCTATATYTDISGNTYSVAYTITSANGAFIGVIGSPNSIFSISGRIL